MLRLLVRQLIALSVILGIALGGVAPSWAATMKSDTKSMGEMSMTVAGMAMDNSCMDMGMTLPGKQMPSKNSDCAACTSCAPNIALVLDLVPVPSLYLRGGRQIGADLNPDGIASPPALPPPILRARDKPTPR